MQIEIDIESENWINMNNKNKFEHTDKQIKHVAKRTLTSLGRNVVLTSLLLQKSNHLFCSKPSPLKQILQAFQINVFSLFENVN